MRRPCWNRVPGATPRRVPLACPCWAWRSLVWWWACGFMLSLLYDVISLNSSMLQSSAGQMLGRN
jgi:hypothetical protein